MGNLQNYFCLKNYTYLKLSTFETNPHSRECVQIPLVPMVIYRNVKGRYPFKTVTFEELKVSCKQGKILKIEINEN